MKRSEIYNGLVEQLNEVTKDLSGEKGYKTISRYYSACCEFSKFLANGEQLPDKVFLPESERSLGI